MPTDKEVVLEKWPYAVPCWGIDWRGDKFRIHAQRKGKLLSAWKRSEDEAWSDAARRIREAQDGK